MHSLSALGWHVNLDNKSGLWQRKNISVVSASTADSVPGHTSLNSTVTQKTNMASYLCSILFLGLQMIDN